jgi:hypothetical protein
MKIEPTTKPSEPEKVNEYMKSLAHPLKEVVEALRQVLLMADPEIGEEIKWNAPTFFFTGEMRPFNPKEFKRYLVVFNLFQKDCIRLVFWHGGDVQDATGFLSGDYSDGRRLAMFYSLEDVKSKEGRLLDVVHQQMQRFER